ncbi:hypothetical protein [Janthinobacterium sp. 61]|uniref:hypothetical protein n=1 Tax=Janthinobacterium sp. 61 TaxID=2035209 RepID=UPI000C710DA2|nr:hypothetical protein [Janthinobacterium sp. 61]
MSPDPTLDTNCILLAEADGAYAPYRSQGKGDAQAEAASKEFNAWRKQEIQNYLAASQLAQALTLEVPDFDFLPQTLNSPALLGEMGAGTALTNVVLGIAHANHVGKSVLVAGTSDPDSASCVLVLPPATVRPINHEKPWCRARGENNACLPWWGIRHDAADDLQGYSQ